MQANTQNKYFNVFLHTEKVHVDLHKKSLYPKIIIFDSMSDSIEESTHTKSTYITLKKINGIFLSH